MMKHVLSKRCWMKMFDCLAGALGFKLPGTLGDRRGRGSGN